jgi:tryptophan halogenase
VLFHHYIAQQRIHQLDRFLVSASAARKGVFAHPPSSPAKGEQELLARAEYGYQFDPRSYARLFEASTNARRVRVVSGRLADVQTDGSEISAIRLADGETLKADFYVDCTGPEALLLSRVGSEFLGSRRLRAAMSTTEAGQLGPPLRTVTPTDYGWRAETPLKGRVHRLTIYDPAAEDEALASHGIAAIETADAVLGRRADARVGNCVALGHAARIVEPLTPAPVMLLEGDVSRLLSLIPLSRDMTVERREYNRRFADDFEHSELFTQALFQTDNVPDTPYWNSVRSQPVSPKLARTLELFEDRGVLVAYDLEPFHQEDWTILHYGMGRRPGRYDRSADRAPAARVQSFLTSFRTGIEKLVDTMPSHARYRAQLEQYLMQNRR